VKSLVSDEQIAKLIFTVHLRSFWCVLQHCYYGQQKVIDIMQVLQSYRERWYQPSLPSHLQ